MSRVFSSFSLRSGTLLSISKNHLTKLLDYTFCVSTSWFTRKSWHSAHKIIRTIIQIYIIVKPIHLFASLRIYIYKAYFTINYSAYILLYNTKQAVVTLKTTPGSATKLHGHLRVYGTPQKKDKAFMNSLGWAGYCRS